MCYGTCPCYLVTVDHSETVTFNGTMHLEKLGLYSWSIDAGAIESLNNDIEKYGYFSLQEPTTYMTCYPSCITSILLQDGTYREIQHYYGEDLYPKEH
jgi:hypothetical protein